jgi:hypothetical protein
LRVVFRVPFGFLRRNDHFFRSFSMRAAVVFRLSTYSRNPHLHLKVHGETIWLMQLAIGEAKA